MKRPLLGLGVLACLILTGCDSGPRRYQVSGDVTYQGKPVPSGTIYFDPDATKGNDGPQGVAAIKDGKYNTSDPDGRGAVGGPHVIRIEAFGPPEGTPDEPGVGRQLSPNFRLPIDLPREASVQNIAIPEERQPDENREGGAP